MGSRDPRPSTPDPNALHDVLIVGAGPCGIAAAIACGQAGLDAVIVERGSVVSGIASYPTYMTFFSTAERIAIGGVPFVIATEKPTRRDALAYYRAVVRHHDVRIRQYELVRHIEPLAPRDAPLRTASGRAARFAVDAVTRGGRATRTLAHAVVVATGYFGTPSLLGVPGEGLPHVTHYFHEGHEAFDQDVVVVGGGNSAVDAALELYRSGARVTMVHFGPGLDPNIKPWVLPDIAARIREGAIHARWNARVSHIDADAVTVRVEDEAGRRLEVLPAQHVYLMTGFLPNSRLLEQLGVPLDPDDGIPEHDPGTMETSLPGVFIAGVIASGFHANRIFIENGRGHGELIAAALRAAAGSRGEG